MIDPHTHSFLRGPEDLASMAQAGVRTVGVCAFLPVSPSGPDTLLDLFQWILGPEASRLRALGLEPIPILGIHPRCLPPAGQERVLDALDELFRSRKAAVLGEVGLETGSPAERATLRAQLGLAARHNLPVVLHTPRLGKGEMLSDLLRELEDFTLDPSKVLVDHLWGGLVERVRERGFVAGLTVQPGKLDCQDVVEIVDRFGPDRLVVDSDLSHAPSDPLAVPAVARALGEQGFSEEVVGALTCKNAARLLGSTSH